MNKELFKLLKIVVTGIIAGLFSAKLIEKTKL